MPIWIANLDKPIKCVNSSLVVVLILDKRRRKQILAVARSKWQSGLGIGNVGMMEYQRHFGWAKQLHIELDQKHLS